MKAGPSRVPVAGPEAATPPAAGYLYALTNPSMPGLVKVGKTLRRPEDRLQELSSATGIPTPFELRHSVRVEDAHEGERTLHQRWEKEGLRTSNGREFFRLPLERAIEDMDHLARLRQGKEDTAVLFERGFALFRGNEGTLRDVPQALQYFEQAEAKGSASGAYWAGRACEIMSEEQPKRGGVWRQKAINHYRQARSKGHLKAEARASWLYGRAKQWQEAALAWDAFLEGAANAASPDAETLRWLARSLERTPENRLDLSHPVWRRHKSALRSTVREMGLRKAALRLRRANARHWPWVVGGLALLGAMAAIWMVHPF